MALHPSFPDSPFEVLEPEIRWFPADESPRDTGMEAIRQNVVKHPVLPDAASRSKLAEAKSDKFTEKYADYLMALTSDDLLPQPDRQGKVQSGNKVKEAAG